MTEEEENQDHGFCSKEPCHVESDNKRYNRRTAFHFQYLRYDITYKNGNDIDNKVSVCGYIPKTLNRKQERDSDDVL